MPDRVLAAMHRAAPNIYTGDLIDLTDSLIPDLKAVARTQHNVAIYISNGHGAWEAALCNVFSPGDKVLVPATGRFAIGWGEMARAVGVDVEVMDFGNETDIDLSRVADRLTQDTDHRIKAVMTVQVDTSTGVKNDVHGLRTTLDAAGHPALLMIDCIACLGCDPFEMDAWGVDVMVTGSQKGLMTPPGLGFVYFNDKADRARETAKCVTNYWDWRPRMAPEQYYQYFDGTAPTHHLFGLREALNMILDEGLDQVWDRHRLLAQAVWAAFDAWSAGGPLRVNIADPAKRSHAVTAANVTAPLATELRTWMEQKAGVTLGIGLGMADPDDPAWHGFFRIGHMGHVNGHMVLGVLGTMEAGLKAIGIPHGPGALAAAADVIAQA
jgi:alanine-glyoxylate transaminase/serine-glyoxylate transaminase/serine-pyruvate transaminase